MFFVYIIANKRNGTLYTGHTDDLGARIYLHKQKVFGGFTSKYNCTKLIWFETHLTRESAFRRERKIKKWNRKWKIRQIEKLNPKWEDLYDGLTEHQVYHDARLYDEMKL